MRRTIPIVICAALVVACAWNAAGLFAGPTGPADGPPTPSAGSVLAPGTATDGASPARRRPNDEREATDERRTREPSFDELLDQLVALGVRMWELVDAGRQDAVNELNAEALALLDTVRVRFANADDLALHRRAGLLVEDATIAGRVRRRVLNKVVRLGLERRWERATLDHDRAPCDALVDSILALLPQDEHLAEDLGIGTLADRPYLGARHEHAVLELAALSEHSAFLRPIAAALLRTLWNNLAADGNRRVVGMALLALDQPNASRRAAALGHLLVADDGRYRRLVLEHVRERRDADLARELARAAAVELAPGESLEVLSSLVSIARPGETTAAFLAVGARAPDRVREAYETRLADGTASKLRAELVTAATAGRGADLGLAETAFEHDPDRAVRERAMFALASHPDPDVAERTLTAALDDPRWKANVHWVRAIAAALPNLATTGGANQLERVGRRLERHPLLSDAERASVTRLLAEHLPR